MHIPPPWATEDDTEGSLGKSRNGRGQKYRVTSPFATAISASARCVCFWLLGLSSVWRAHGHGDIYVSATNKPPHVTTFLPSIPDPWSVSLPLSTPHLLLPPSLPLSRTHTTHRKTAPEHQHPRPTPQTLPLLVPHCIRSQSVRMEVVTETSGATSVRLVLILFHCCLFDLFYSSLSM